MYAQSYTGTTWRGCHVSAVPSVVVEIQSLVQRHGLLMRARVETPDGLVHCIFQVGDGFSYIQIGHEDALLELGTSTNKPPTCVWCVAYGHGLLQHEEMFENRT